MSHGKKTAPLIVVAATMVSLALAGCLSASETIPGQSIDGGLLPPLLEFAPEVLVDGNHRGGEPSILVDQNNHYYMSAPSGLVTSTFNSVLVPQTALAMGPHNRQSFIWKSEDQGASWRLLTITPPPLPPLRTDVAQGVVGGGDTELAMDACGTIYFSDLWLGNLAVSHSQDGGDTWIGVPLSAHQSPVDRQWLAAGECGELWMAYQTFSGEVWVIKSTDSGMTFPQQVMVTTDYSIIGNLERDPVDGILHLVLGTGSGNGVQVVSSADDGMTWTQSTVFEGESSIVNIFPAVAVDAAGNVFTVWSQHRGGSYNIYLSGSQDQGRTWSAPRAVSGPEGAGTEVFPWVAAGDAGRVAVVWYGVADTKETTDEVEGDWHVFMAATMDAFAEVPSWSLEQVTTEPMHKDEICTQGLGCTLPQPLGTRGNRNLADFFEVAIDNEGRAVIAYANDYDTADELISLPYFAGQSGGMRFREPAMDPGMQH